MDKLTVCANNPENAGNEDMDDIISRHIYV